MMTSDEETGSVIGQEVGMLGRLAASWWLVALRGLVAIAFGAFLLGWPLAGLEALVLLFGLYALLDGAIAVGAALRDPGQRRWELVEGAAGVLAGGFALVLPDVAAVILLYLIAFWAIATGALELMAAVWLRKQIAGEWLLGLAGAASILFGLFLIARPVAGLFAVVWLVGLYALAFGFLLLLLGLRRRRGADRSGSAARGPGSRSGHPRTASGGCR